MNKERKIKDIDASIELLEKRVKQDKTSSVMMWLLGLAMLIILASICYLSTIYDYQAIMEKTTGLRFIIITIAAIIYFSFSTLMFIILGVNDINMARHRNLLIYLKRQEKKK